MTFKSIDRKISLLKNKLNSELSKKLVYKENKDQDTKRINNRRSI